MDQSGQVQEKKGTVILATVKGDIHDIGKNIVKVLLENYGYDVMDLGKMCIRDSLLADWVTSKIGDEWITDLPHIKKLEIYADDEKCQQEFLNIKYQNKIRLAKYIKEHNGIDVDPRCITS